MPVEISIFLISPLYFMALSMRLIMASVTASASAFTAGRLFVCFTEHAMPLFLK